MTAHAPVPRSEEDRLALLAGHRPEAGNGQAPRPLRVLIVEDHRDTADMMARLLTMDGYEVRAAYSAAAALRAVEAEPFDVVVSDIGLPDATGYDLMSRIKDIGDMQGIALSGYGMEDDMQRSAAAGFSEHMIKPVNMARLHAVIQRLHEQS